MFSGMSNFWLTRSYPFPPVLRQIQSGYQDVLSGSALSSTYVTPGFKKQDGDGGNANLDL